MSDKKETTLSKEVQEAIALSTAMVAEALKDRVDANKPHVKGRPTFDETRCGECGQYKVGCKGKHAQVVVWPSNPHFARFFQGYRLNGVTYISNGPSHAITVPAEAEIGYAVAKWTENEEVTSQGRVAPDHNSGTVNNFVPATAGWR